jgi:hypothetical protein
VGDWGTQFGMLILYLKEEYPDFMSNPPNITDLTTFYKNAKGRFDESPDFKDKARLGVVELQAGNPESRCVRACVHACVRACVRACVSRHAPITPRHSHTSRHVTWCDVDRFLRCPALPCPAPLRADLPLAPHHINDTPDSAIWQLLCDISRKEFQKVYDRLEVRLEECGESFYNEMIPAAIDALRSKKLLEEDGGATIMWCGPKYQIPLMVRKSDGGYGYDSTDLAAVRYRLETLERDWVIYITDAGQATHFHMVFDAARLVGWAKDERHRLDHVGFGVVQGEDGKRFKTRSGDTVRLVDLLDEAVQRMKASLLERIKDGKTTLTEAEAQEAAHALGYGAVKYADLKQNPTTDYQFSYDRCVACLESGGWGVPDDVLGINDATHLRSPPPLFRTNKRHRNRMLDTKGDTAIYLLFTCARFHSILRKAEEEKGINVKELVAAGDVVLEHPVRDTPPPLLSCFHAGRRSAPPQKPVCDSNHPSTHPFPPPSLPPPIRLSPHRRSARWPWSWRSSPRRSTAPSRSSCPPASAPTSLASPRAPRTSSRPATCSLPRTAFSSCRPPSRSSRAAWSCWASNLSPRFKRSWRGDEVGCS